MEDDKKHKQEREEEEKKQLKIKNERDDKLKAIESNIAGIKSEIDKNKDALVQLEAAQQFIMKIVCDIDPVQFETRKNEREKKLAFYKKKWIEGA